MATLRPALALGVCLVAPACWFALSASQPSAGSQGPIVTANPAPTPAQLRSLTARAIENQHRDDRALEEYERTEHMVAHKGENMETVTDVTQRVLPSATGNVRIKLAENGVAVSPELYRQELENAISALGRPSHPDDRYKDDLEKYEKRRHNRSELVDEAAKAFHVTWAGRETRADSIGPHGPRTLMKFLLDPEPEYKPINRFAASFQHIHATLWVDEEQVQFARVEADIATDITFGGGVAGKVYHGGHVVMVQDEVAPRIWLPTLFTYNVDGRKFVFAFGVHERTEITHYHHIGRLPEALEALRAELNTLTAAAPAR